jgi:hypothetical protein
MKIFIVTIISICFIVLSCSNSTNTGDTGNNEDVKGFDGRWEITMKGVSEVCTIETGNGYMRMCGAKYIGSYSGDSFTGSYTQNDNGVKTVAKLSI